MTAIRLGRERLTAVSNGFADLISATCGSGPASPNGFLNGSVFGNDMGSLVCSHTGEVGEYSRRCPVRSSPENTSPCNAATSIAGMPHLAAHRQSWLLAFGSFVLTGPFVDSITLRENEPLLITSRSPF